MKQVNLNSRQQGFSLIMVLAMMMIIALMVIAASHTSSTEVRMAANSADARYAFSIAEKTLLFAETEAAKLNYHTVTGTYKIKTKAEIENTFPGTPGQCSATDGKCAYDNRDGSSDKRTTPWTSADTWKNKSKEINDAARIVEATNTAQRPRYIIEYLGEHTVDGANQRLMRITARSWGKNNKTSVMVQSTIALPTS